jgi:hypothetical protein
MKNPRRALVTIPNERFSISKSVNYNQAKHYRKGAMAPYTEAVIVNRMEHDGEVCTLY